MLCKVGRAKFGCRCRYLCRYSDHYVSNRISVGLGLPSLSGAESRGPSRTSRSREVRQKPSFRTSPASPTQPSTSCPSDTPKHFHSIQKERVKRPPVITQPRHQLFSPSATTLRPSKWTSQTACKSRRRELACPPPPSLSSSSQLAAPTSPAAQDRSERH